MMKLLFCIFVFFSNQVFAAEIKCIVTNSTQKQDELVGGAVQISVEDGNLVAFKNGESLPIINDSVVSRFKADRSHCTFGKQILVSGDTLLALWAEFNACMHTQNDQVGYVTAKFSADLRSKNGRYSEIFATSSGPVPYVELELSECKRID